MVNKWSKTYIKCKLYAFLFELTKYLRRVHFKVTKSIHLSPLDKLLQYNVFKLWLENLKKDNYWSEHKWTGMGTQGTGKENTGYKQNDQNR